MLIAVNYHYIRESFDFPYPSIFGITPDKFEKQLLKLAEYGVFVSQEDIVTALTGSRPLPDKSFIVTFDDGLKEQYDLAVPILRKLGIPAIFFPNTRPLAEGNISSVHKIHLIRSQISPQDFLEKIKMQLRGFSENEVDKMKAKATSHYKYDEPEIAFLKFLLNFALDFRAKEELIDEVFKNIYPDRELKMSRELYMSREEVKVLSDAGMIGSHSHDHFPVGLLEDGAQLEQIRESTNLLTEITGKKPVAFSYPYGSPEACGERAAAKLKAAGYQFAFTTNRNSNLDLENPMLLSRFDNNDMPLGKANLFKTENVFEEARQMHSVFGK